RLAGQPPGGRLEGQPVEVERDEPAQKSSWCRPEPAGGQAQWLDALVGSRPGTGAGVGGGGGGYYRGGAPRRGPRGPRRVPLRGWGAGWGAAGVADAGRGRCTRRGAAAGGTQATGGRRRRR